MTSPRVAAFVASCVRSAADLALGLAGEDDHEVEATLDKTRANLAEKLTAEFGAENAALLADAFVAAVRGRRAEINAKPRGHG